MSNLKQTLPIDKLHLKAEIKKLHGTFEILVDPNLADKWLKLNTENRPLSASHIRQLSKRMANDEWHLNGQAIIFSNTGNLLDGQHRLEAVKLYGDVVLFDVRFGINASSFHTLDDGKKRTAADVFAIEKIPNYTNTASSIRLIFSLQRMYSSSQMSTELRPSNQEVLKWFYDHPEISDYVLLGMQWYDISGRILSPSEFAGFCWMMAQKDEDQAYAFMSKIAIGSNLSAKEPAFKLRAKLMQAKVDRTKKMKNSYKRALIIKSWNYYRRGQQPKILKYDIANEKFPVFE
jgi:hypothetical protein